MSCEAESEKNEQNQNIFSQKEPEIKFRKFSFRAAIGPSMGGSVAARLGLKYSEKLDFIGIGGTPIADTLEFYRMIRRFWLGGYCSLDKLEEFNKLNLFRLLNGIN